MVLRVDGETGFVGGINLIDDRIDLHHGRTELPRLDFAVQPGGPLAEAMAHAIRAMWSRAWFGRPAGAALAAAGRPSGAPGAGADPADVRTRRSPHLPPLLEQTLAPVQAAFVVRDNIRQRRTIERAYIDAIRQARERIWLISPYFYPGQEFRRALCSARRCGVQGAAADAGQAGPPHRRDGRTGAL